VDAASSALVLEIIHVETPKRDDAIALEFPAELLAEARSKPGGWVYAIDPGYASDGADGAVPPEGIIGAWKIGDDGRPTGEYRANDRIAGVLGPGQGLAAHRPATRGSEWPGFPGIPGVRRPQARCPPANPGDGQPARVVPDRCSAQAVPMRPPVVPRNALHHPPPGPAAYSGSLASVR
jgi:hypothetical protein